MQVDTQICEQTFSWMSRYSRITRHMNRQHFLFYLLYISDLHHRKLCSFLMFLVVCVAFL